MKKIIAIVCAVLMLVSLTACGGANDAKYTIGICQLKEHGDLDAATEGFMQAVKDALGEENVAFQVEKADGDVDSCIEVVNGFVSDGVDLILANGTTALQAAYTVTKDIPILGTSITEFDDATGLDDSTGILGGNVSGTSEMSVLIDQAVMVLEWFFEAESVGMLYCADDLHAKAQLDTLSDLLVETGVDCELFPFTDKNDLAAVTQTACDFADVVYVPNDAVAAAEAGTIGEVCNAAGVPILTSDEQICADCAVAATFIDYNEMGAATGTMAAKILAEDADIAEIPIEYVSSAGAVYNEKTCEDLGLTPVAGYSPMG